MASITIHAVVNLERSDMYRCESCGSEFVRSHQFMIHIGNHAGKTHISGYAELMVDCSLSHVHFALRKCLCLRT